MVTRVSQVDHNRQKKAAVINDFTSFGRCSLAVTIPILSALKVQCCPVPTAFFTNHTGYPSFAWTDYTDHLDDYIREWQKLHLRFDAIATGFLGSRRQVDFVQRFLEAFRDEHTLVVVDPVMGDYGQLYATYDSALAESMRAFLDVADILTPNLTEACVLANRPYDPAITDAELAKMCEFLTSRHANKVVVSGIARGSMLVNFVHERGQAPQIFAEPKIGNDRSGSGDVFASVILADAVNGVSFAESVHRASSFVAKAVARTVEMGIPEHDGLAIEEVLSCLVQR
ncbi:MAG: pyridoxamine kinase [Victivallales bacterium]|nr:pyridoxamine kinase [Victivallales bacterium]